MIILATQTISTYDLFFSHLIQKLTFPPLYSFLWLVSYLGNVFPLFFILTICLIYFYTTHHKRAALYAFLATGIGVTLSTYLKLFIGRPRPSSDLVTVLVNNTDFSFPSTHCVSFTILFGFLIFYLSTSPKISFQNRFLRFVFLLLIISIGISRVYLGAHWLSDCLGGYLLGFLVLFITILKYKNAR